MLAPKLIYTNTSSQTVVINAGSQTDRYKLSSETVVINASSQTDRYKLSSQTNRHKH